MRKTNQTTSKPEKCKIEPKELQYECEKCEARVWKVYLGAKKWICEKCWENENT